MWPRYVMGERQPGDGEPGKGDFSIGNVGDDIVIECRTDGKRVALRVSVFNALRILGCLSLILGRPLTKRGMKGISLT